MKHVLLCLCSLVLVACASAPPFSVDPALVRPYSPRLEAKEPFKEGPYLVEYRKDGKTLLFIAAHHEMTRDSATFKLIDQTFLKYPVDFALIEGVENEKPNLRFLERVQRSIASTFWEGGEAAYTAYMATQRGAAFEGVEPSEDAVVDAVLKRGYTIKDLLGFYFVRQIPQYKRQRALDRDNIETLFHEFTNSQIPRWKKAAGLDFSWADFQDWYEKANGKDFNLESFDSEEAAPRLRGKYKTQKISGVVGLTRDRFIVSLIGKRLRTFKTVLIVMGRSHLPCQRPALQEMLGKPVAQISTNS